MFLRTGCQAREYSFSEVFFFFFLFFLSDNKVYFLAQRFFFNIRLKNLMGHTVLNFLIFLQVFEWKMFTRFLGKILGAF